MRKWRRLCLHIRDRLVNEEEASRWMLPIALKPLAEEWKVILGVQVSHLVLILLMLSWVEGHCRVLVQDGRTR